MSAQLDYPNAMDKWRAGMRTQIGFDTIESLAAESGPIAPGVVVSSGTDKEKQGVVGGAEPRGVTAIDLARMANDAGELEYADTETMAVLQDGPIVVEVQDNGNKGDVLNYNTTTGLIGVGAPGTGEAALKGELLSTVLAAPELAEIRVFFQNS